ncbi:protein phosphatase 1 regulatory inhibitor subunit 16B-like isoform X2 [Varroa jacobsoni]|uniref:Protein phosphatase 1 regulatory subunit 16A n=1 Tax=Varroa destructor TaxID=109461 RepID=A0A7M7J978_VARDE|nr:protein phosphatase 1 regulatory inhibitor subunit 16B-like isoform X3 [Varroa destructor]XP_022696439.1 protein phosphatase 1 regulatory inhibitor subunit 16B-like isoform X2 [Varroa jacobsoni]
MAEHHELVEEMTTLERMSTQERLKHAKKRRIQQLKKWTQREKELKRKEQRQEKSGAKLNNGGGRLVEYKVHFVPSVMLLEAAARNDVEEVRRLLMMGVSPDSTNEDGLTALHQCCIDNNEEMTKLLVEFGANVNAKDSEQWTPLHAAATCGHLHLVKYLILKGADLLSVNADGNMPYDICEDEPTLDHIETEMAKRGITQHTIDTTRAAAEMHMLRELREHRLNGVDLDWRDEQLATPLHIASANGYISVVEFLLENGVATDAADCDLWQPIHAAACWGHPDVVELLVQSGADLNAKTKNGETPFDICEDPELKERIKELRNEMEIKRLSQLSQRLRRSHSQNTRSQSVRRTSVREKNKISRREAIEEARIRQENQSRNAISSDGTNGRPNDEDSPGNSPNNNKTGSLSNGDALRPAGSDQIDSITVANNNQIKQQQQQQQQAGQSLQSQLAMGPPRYEEVVQQGKNARTAQNNHTYETLTTTATNAPKSPEGPTPAGILHDSDMKRFRGAEVVGGETGARFCCSLM